LNPKSTGPDGDLTNGVHFAVKAISCKGVWAELDLDQGCPTGGPAKRYENLVVFHWLASMGVGRVYSMGGQ